MELEIKRKIYICCFINLTKIYSLSTNDQELLKDDINKLLLIIIQYIIILYPLLSKEDFIEVSKEYIDKITKLLNDIDENRIIV